MSDECIDFAARLEASRLQVRLHFAGDESLDDNGDAPERKHLS